MARPNKGPRLEINPAGLYEIRWTDNGRSKRKSTKTSDRQKAEKQLQRFSELGCSEIKIDNILDHYQKSDGFLNASDQKGVLDSIYILSKSIGSISYKSLTLEIINQFINDRIAGIIKPGNRPNFRPGPVKLSTAKKNITILKAALNHAWKSGLIEYPKSELFPRLSREGFLYKKDEKNSLYIMKCRRSGYYKIGVSDIPEFRETTLQAENPDIVMVACFPAHAKNEKRIHKYFSNQNIRGEWFKLNNIQIRWLCYNLANKTFDEFRNFIEGDT